MTAVVPPLVVSLRKNFVFYLIAGILVVALIVIVILDNLQQDIEEPVLELTSLIVLGVVGGVFVALLWLHWRTFKKALEIQDFVNKLLVGL